MREFDIKGAEDFLKLSKALKNAGRTGLRKTLHAGIKKAAQPLVPKAQASARDKLPKRGGLNEVVASSPIRIQVRTGRNLYGVRIVVGKQSGSGARAANRGVIRHPVFGNRDVWVDQPVPPGWFDDVTHAEEPQIKAQVQQAAQQVIDDIAKEAK